jgi:hypothetical protein
MANNKPNEPRSTADILREMEEMVGDAERPAAKKSGGAFKSLMDFFVKVVPEESEAPAPVASSVPPPPPQPRRVSEIVAPEPAPQFAAPAAQGTDYSQLPFDELYQKAKLPASPCSVDELAKLFDSPAVAGQPQNVKVIAVNLALTAKGITAEAPIADAVRRDRALDAYQSMLDERAQTTEANNQKRIQQMTQEVEEFLKRKQAEMDALRTEIAETKRQSLEFASRRSVEEQRLAMLISPFLEGQDNPVTVGNQAAPSAAPAPTPTAPPRK